MTHRRWVVLAGWLVMLIAVSFFFNYLGLVIAAIMAGYDARRWDDWAPAFGRGFVNSWSVASGLVIPKLKWSLGNLQSYLQNRMFPALWTQNGHTTRAHFAASRRGGCVSYDVAFDTMGFERQNIERKEIRVGG